MWPDEPVGEGRRVRTRGGLFGINIWPPMVDALALILCAFVLIFLVGALRQAEALRRSQRAEQELLRTRADKEALRRRLDALARGGLIHVEDGKVILQGEILFDSGSEKLRPEGRAALSQISQALRPLLAAQPDQMILVGGHTDNVPISTARFPSNWTLSTARAEAVVSVLVEAGVPPGQILIGGFGAHRPRRDNATEEGRRQNRRIEVLLVPIRSVSTR